MSILDFIESPRDLKNLSVDELEQLAGEIRAFLIESVSHTGGHLASNLGVVELTIALHRVFDVPQDKLIFDVGHQCYVHKILTGRRGRMDTLRSIDGLSGFPKPYESAYDCFGTGHSSTSISLALGFATADKLAGRDNSSVAVIGDGALTGGMAFEALNNAGRSKTNTIVVLNDNGMAISRNVGGIARGMTRIRISRRYFHAKDRVHRFLSRTRLGMRLDRGISRTVRAVKDVMYDTTWFEDFNFVYLGPVDGHDIGALTVLLDRAKQLKKPCVVHVVTKKGRGFSAAEHDPVTFHGAPHFDAETGVCESPGEPDFSAAFGGALLHLAEKDERICAVTAAMADGCGLQQFKRACPARFFDVGIAEQHAVTFSAALSAGGYLPVFAVYSTFLQRAYDQVLHDAALSGTKLVLGVDRAGIVGGDGETHQGLFDVPLLCGIPGVTVLCPASFDELRTALEQALYQYEGVVAVRYPRGGEPACFRGVDRMHEPVSVLLEPAGKTLALVSYGRETADALDACALLSEYGPALFKLNRVSPLPDGLHSLLREYRYVVAVEESMRAGGVGERLAALLSDTPAVVKTVAVDGFVEHGAPALLRARLGLDGPGIAGFCMRECKL